MRRKKRGGFTVAECLISIAVLAISLTGVLAALAYDQFASEQSGNYTFALNYSRKLMDMLQSGQIDPMAFAATGNPPALTSNQNNDGTNWHNLDEGVLGTGGGVVNFWGPPGSIERLRFETEKQKYGVSYVANRVLSDWNIGGNDPTNKFKNLLVELVVTTRWRSRAGFRSVQLRGYYATSKAP